MQGRQTELISGEIVIEPPKRRSPFAFVCECQRPTRCVGVHVVPCCLAEDRLPTEAFEALILHSTQRDTRRQSDTKTPALSQSIKVECVCACSHLHVSSRGFSGFWKAKKCRIHSFRSSAKLPPSSFQMPANHANPRPLVKRVLR